MQLVITVTTALVAVVTMVTMVTMVGAECRVNHHCRPVAKSIEVKVCGVSKNVETTVCDGNCYNLDMAQLSSLPDMQNVCVGHWLKEEVPFPNCSKAVTIWRAHNCSCGLCPTRNVDCENLDLAPAQSDPGPGPSSCKDV